jgi:hypothetical protein
MAVLVLFGITFFIAMIVWLTQDRRVAAIFFLTVLITIIYIYTARDSESFEWEDLYFFILTGLNLTAIYFNVALYLVIRNIRRKIEDQTDQFYKLANDLLL